MEASNNYQILPYVLGYTQENAYKLTAEETETIARLLETYNGITEQFPVSLGQAESKKERDSLQDANDSSLVYGEIDFVSFAEIFATIKSRYNFPQDGMFYDLGSGVGKAVIAAALLHPFQECIGIEKLGSLHDAAVRLKDQYSALSLPTKVSFYNTDIFEYDWSDASFLFANSTCFDFEMMARIGNIPVKPGTLGVSFTKPFYREEWKILESIKKPMSWGPATVYIQEKS